MKWSSRDFEAALEALPLFPLPQAVLFPGVLLPLHVFEPRYRKLIHDVLATHATFSVVRLLEEETPSQLPAIAPVATAGTIIDHVELPGGRLNVLLRGRARVRLRELSFEPPYRRAHASLLEDSNERIPSSDVAALIGTATAFCEALRNRDPHFELRLPREADPGALADSCASQLLLDGRDRQRALELLNVSERIRYVTEMIAMQRCALSGSTGALN